ncbi:membrane glyco [Chlorella sorokiniana]|uniref:Membrane glyco n=1 Tax=Chlorella sorokiniana TaxID=3076 RepID=A0A2P6TLC9_CHLSO|nr:membrane glyco [Chlorella sorokiniana]|eukprot:PRW45084.1 membrane glyco [Chlorella sorokiniana]
MKALSLLALMLLAGAACAWRQEHEDKPHPPPILPREVLRCIKNRDCLGEGWRPVCAGNKALNTTGAFPNWCYMHCANKQEGVHWEKLFSYRASRYCIKNWTRDPATCSVCPVFEHKPDGRPEH